MSTTEKKRSGGRPPSLDPKDQKIDFRLTLAEKTQIQANARAVGLTASEFLLRLGLRLPVTYRSTVEHQQDSMDASH